jgi:hypothetical protein
MCSSEAHFNSRGEVDLVDMQSMPDGNYSFTVNYQDHLTKICVVESLTPKRATVTAYKRVFIVWCSTYLAERQWS